MSPDIPLQVVEWFFALGPVGIVIGLMALVAIFRGWHFYKLLSGDAKKNRAVFDEAKTLIKNEYWGTRYRAFLKKILGKLTSIIGDHYRFPDEPPKLRADDPRLKQLQKPDTLRRVFGVNPLTVESYQFCFLLAFLYPILSFISGWAIGGNGDLGDINLLEIDKPLWQRLALLLVFLITFSTQIFLRNHLSRNFSIIGILVIGSVAGIAGGVAYSIGGSRISDLTFILIIFGSFALSAIFAKKNLSTDTYTLAIIGALNIAALITSFLGLTWQLWVIIFFISACILGYSYSTSKSRDDLPTYWFLFTLLMLTFSLATLHTIENISTYIFIVFYLILPLINTPIDWLSLGITRSLLQSIRFNQHRIRMALVWSTLDLALALFAMLLISSSIVTIISLSNMLATYPIIDLKTIFMSLSSLENWRDNLWIYFMLLSTLIPTAIHFALAGGALTLSVSRKTRMKILSDMETNDLNAKRAWLYVSIMPAFGFVLAPTLLLYSLYWLLHTHGAWLGQNLLSWAIWLATLIDPTLGHISTQGI